jgi:hypothetical protein
MTRTPLFIVLGIALALLLSAVVGAALLAGGFLVIADASTVGTTPITIAEPPLTLADIVIAPVSPAPSPTADLTPEPVVMGWLAGPEIDYAGVAFTLDPGLGTAVYPTQPQEEIVLIQFGQNEEGQCHRQPFCLTVYDAAAYRATLGHGDWLLDLVSAAAAGQPVKQFPTVGSAVLLQAQTKHIAFQNGAGIRAVVMKGQTTHLAHSGAVYYEFHGASADGLVYVTLTAHLDHPLLLDNFEARLNGRDTALPPPNLSMVIDDDDAFYGVIRKYNAAVAAHFEMAQPGDFTPDLSLLDQLAASLLIQP